jgi:hypothetical protein
MQTTVDKKVLDRVRKLLVLSKDGGATEAEAATAAELARKIMAENGISNATIEAGGGQGEGRTKTESNGFVSKPWHRDIMEALCEQSFVTSDWHSGWKGKPGRWELWGRESAVVTVQLMHQYLVKTVHRSVREVMRSTSDEVFMTAMGTRIADRIRNRHYEAMQAQKRAAQAQPQQYAASPGSNALTIVLEDYAQKERELNADLRNGWEPGETARRRLASELAYAQRVEEARRRTEERAKQREALLAEGLSELIVDLIMEGFSRDRAHALAEEHNSPEGQEKARRAQERRHAEYKKWEERDQRLRAKREAQRNSPSYRAGVQAGDSVGLDAQVDQRETKKLS